MKLKKGDEVKIVAGKDKGKTGKVEKVLPDVQKVLVTGVNQYKRHMKGKSQGQKSEIITITKPLPVANVMLICPKCHLTARVGYQIVEGKLAKGQSASGGKERICKKCQQTL